MAARVGSTGSQRRRRHLARLSRRRLGAQEAGNGDRGSRLFRSPHRAAEPPPAADPHGAGDRRLLGARRPRRAAVHRPRQFQDAERHAGPRHRRRLPRAGRRAPAAVSGAARHGGAHRRRRIRGHPARGRRRPPARDATRHPCGQPGAGRAAGPFSSSARCATSLRRASAWWSSTDRKSGPTSC